MSKDHQTTNSIEINDQQKSIFVLIIAISAVSSAAPLVKSLTLDPLLIAFWRTLIVSCALAFTLKKHHLSISKQNLLLSFGAGIFLAFHFWSWFSSLHLIGSLRSTTLVCLNPIWVGLIEFFVWKIRHRKQFWIGTLLAIIGVGIMGYEPSENSEWQLQGDLLALLGGFLGAIYLLIGQKVRQSVDIQPYGFLVCSSAAICLSILCLRFELSFSGYDMPIWLTLIALAVGPQFLGHIGLNFCLKKLSASIVSLSLLLEPVGASLLSLLLLKEIPSNLEMIGSLIILCGVAIGLKRS